ncbi:MAG TPA: glutamyl-tRNA reductase [Solirubrobacteraceae bacterium]|nr:glutamyl-tRNA reductase [Solirubrobacteraceae bacterium]
MPVPDGRGRLLVVGLSRHGAPLEALERASLRAHGARRVLRALRAGGEIDEAVALSTCNRTEIYAVVGAAPVADAIAAVRDILACNTRLSAHELVRLGYARVDEAAVEHFLAVVAGLDSAVLGEPEIVAQVRAAVALAGEEGTLGRVLMGLWNHGLAAGRRVRAGTSVARGAVSISAVAVDLAETLTTDLGANRTLVIGAGRVARAVAKRLAGRGAESIVVANRSLAAAEEIARDVGGRAVGLEALSDELAEADLVLTATGSASHVVSRSMLAHATRGRASRMVLLDLAVPRDVDPAAGGLATVTLCDIDEIHRIARDNLDDRRRELPDAWAIVHGETERFHAWRSGLGAEQVLRALRRQAEEIRSLELARVRTQSPPADEAELARLDAVTRSLVNKLLHEATSRIRQAGGTSAGRAQLEAVRDLLGFDEIAAEPLRSERAPAA